NLLGEVGKGHKIAFNILNIGRYKLGAACVGGCKFAIEDAVKYANQRHQFGQPLSAFGMIQHKLGEMGLNAWLIESMVYRTAGLIEELLATVDKESPQEVLKGIEEYAIECSILKVYASEALDQVVDEMVQIYGGNGYSAEYPAERAYRDSRINRIFEGTNEINRLLIPGMLLKRAMKGQLPLLAAAQKIAGELMSLPAPAAQAEGPLGAERELIGRLKKALLLVAGIAAQKFGPALEKEQEVLGHLADMTMEVYAAESAVLRALKRGSRDGGKVPELWLALARLATHRSAERIELSGRHALSATSAGDDLRIQLGALKRFTKFEPASQVALRRQIAAHLIQENRYAL
ncbi:MAG TPA: acyl-CoA dehydrogenase family protein, partial [Acidobacteriota bacterium]